MYDKTKLLIVDDSPDDVYIIKEFLKDIVIPKYEIFHEKSLDSTLKLLDKKDKRFDCILLDLNLPDSLGTDTLKDLLDQYPELPIVVMTIIDDEDVAIRSLHEGAQDYLVKGKINGDIISRSVRYAIERKKVENGLRESEKKYRNIADTILEGLWITDAEGNTTYINKQLAKMLGYAEEDIEKEILNRPFFNFVDKSLQNDARQFFERRKKGIKDRYDFRFIKKDGSILWVIVSASPIFDKRGKFAGAMGLLTDITDRKLIEQSLQKSVQEWNATFNSISDIICIIDLNGKITHCNHASFRLFKKSNKEIIGKTCWDVLSCPSERLKNCPIINMQKSHKRETLTLQIDDKWFHASVDPIIGSDNNIVGGVHIISDITKYKLSQEALKESESALKKSQHMAHIGHWIWYPKTNKLIWSDEMFNIFGITKDQFKELQSDLDKIIDKIIHPDDILKIRKSNEKIKLEGCTETLEYRIIWPDKTIHIVRAEPGEKNINGSGHIERLFGVVQDITEQKLMQDKLIESIEKYRLLFEGAIDAIFIADPETGIILDANTQAEKLLKKSRDQIINKHQATLHPPDTTEYPKCNILEHIDTKCGMTIYNDVITSDNKRIPVEINSSVITLPSGKHITQGIFRDITERKIADEKLRESEEKWRTLTENSPEYVVMIDQNGIIQFINRTIILTREQVIGTSIYDNTPDKFKQNVRDSIKKVKKTREPQRYYTECIDPKTGDIKSFSCNIGPLIKSNEIIGFVITYQDITENIKAAKELERLNEKLETSNKELQDFAYIASHDLQEPLRTIYGFVELLSDNYKGKLGPEADEYIGFITNGTKRMQDMINDLLAISRVGTKGKKFVSTDIEKVLKIVSDNLQSLINQNQAIITHDPMPTIIADDSQMIQLFQNLIENAIKFRREETPKIHISYKKQISDPYDEDIYNDHLFSVKDNGIGIDKRQFKKLFVIFQRLHNREEYPGTGIGLAMCKKIVERHGGRIWVESEVGIGSTFYFTIPVN